MEKNAGEWTERVKMSKEQIPGSKRSMHGNILTDLLQALKGEPLSSVFSSGGTLMFASAAPHREGRKDKELSGRTFLKIS